MNESRKTPEIEEPDVDMPVVSDFKGSEPSAGPGVDPAKLTLGQLVSSLTLGQLWACLAAAGGLAVVIFGIGTFYGRSTVTVENPLIEGQAPDGQRQTLELKPGQILATHYRTGELFALEAGTNALVRVSALLEEPTDMAVRPGGEIIVLQVVEQKGNNIIFLKGVDPRTGRHRYIAAGASPPCVELAACRRGRG